jgi:CheY-like chemotaxis protein
MKPIHILLAEDNEGDILLTTEALEEAKIASTISVVRDGMSAINFLNKKNDYAHESFPDLLLLDVNLPRKNGHEVLQYIKRSDDLRHLPVIMLTTSSSEKDIIASYKNFANCYITKPVEVNDFQDVIIRIKEFWTNIVRLPNM